MELSIQERLKDLRVERGLTLEATILLPYQKRGDSHLPEIKREFSQKLKGFRKENYLTQKQLAKQLDVAETTLRLWEQGKTPPHSFFARASWPTRS